MRIRKWAKIKDRLLTKIPDDLEIVKIEKEMVMFPKHIFIFTFSNNKYLIANVPRRSAAYPDVSFMWEEMQVIEIKSRVSNKLADLLTSSGIATEYEILHPYEI